MDGLSGAASIIAVIQITEEVLGYIRAVRNASKERKLLLREASSLLGVLTTLSNLVKDADDTDQEWRSAVRLLETENGPLSQCRENLAELAQKLKPETGLRKAGQVAMWRVTKEDVKESLQQIERVKSLALLALEMDHIKLAQGIRDELHGVHKLAIAVRDDTAYTRDAIDAIKVATDETAIDSLAEWFCATDYSADFQYHIAWYQPHTAQWFLEDSRFLEWMRSSTGALLFCPGRPGAGKSVIASKVIDVAQGFQRPVAFVYCDHKRQGEQDLLHCLSTLVRQLIQIKGSAPPAAFELRITHRKPKKTRPTSQELFAVLKAILASRPFNDMSILIVVDGIDELDVRNCAPFVECLRQLQDETGGINLLVTSRPIPEVESLFGNDTTIAIVTAAEDMGTYLRERLHELPDKIQHNEQLRNAVIEGITEAASGLFLLARLQMSNIVVEVSPAAVRKILANMKASRSSPQKLLHDLYQASMDRVLGQTRGRRGLAIRTLSWIVRGKRPLTPQELQHAVATEIDEDSLDLDEIPSIDLLVSVCAGLISVDEQESVFRLHHKTAQEYLEQNQETWRPDFCLDIVRVGVTYMTFSEVANTWQYPIEDEDCEDCEGEFCYDIGYDSKPLVGNFPLLRYLGAFTGAHCVDLERSATDEQLRLLLPTLRRLVHRRKGLAAALDAARNWPTPGATVWGFLSKWDLPRLAFLLATDVGNDWGQTKTFYDPDLTPLLIAAQNSSAVVESLLRTGIYDVNAVDLRGDTALHMVVKRGFEGAVRALLRHEGVDVESRNKLGRTPLDYAVEGKGEKAIERLISERLRQNSLQ